MSLCDLVSVIEENKEKTGTHIGYAVGNLNNFDFVLFVLFYFIVKKVLR